MGTFNKITTGAQNDLDKVTKMAYAQIREFGFNDQVGLVSFDMSGGGKKLFSPEEMMDRMCMALGGRVAESLTFNKITTGAQNDLDKVTKMAYAQIREFGFNDQVGLVSFDMSGGGKKPYSKRLAATMDLEARKMIGSAYTRTEELLLEHKDKLEIMAQRL